MSILYISHTIHIRTYPFGFSVLPQIIGSLVPSPGWSCLQAEINHTVTKSNMDHQLPSEFITGITAADYNSM